MKTEQMINELRAIYLRERDEFLKTVHDCDINEQGERLLNLERLQKFINTQDQEYLLRRSRETRPQSNVKVTNSPWNEGTI